MQNRTRNTTQRTKKRYFPLDGWLRKDHGWCDQLTTDEFQYSLKFKYWSLWCTFLTEHEVNSITHSLMFMQWRRSVVK